MMLLMMAYDYDYDDDGAGDESGATSMIAVMVVMMIDLHRVISQFGLRFDIRATQPRLVSLLRALASMLAASLGLL